MYSPILRWQVGLIRGSDECDVNTHFGRKEKQLIPLLVIKETRASKIRRGRKTIRCCCSCWLIYDNNGSIQFHQGRPASLCSIPTHLVIILVDGKKALTSMGRANNFLGKSIKWRSLPLTNKYPQLAESFKVVEREGEMEIPAIP